MTRTRVPGPTLVYDGECWLCSAFARIMRRLIPGLRILPFQVDQAASILAGLSQEEVEGSAHLVLPDGRILSGAASFSAALDLLPLLGRFHRRLCSLAPLRIAEAILYRIGAEVRARTACARLRGFSS